MSETPAPAEPEHTGNAEASAPDVQALLADWRVRHAAKAPPLRRSFIEALARRAEGRSGSVRQLLDARLLKLLSADDAASPVAPARRQADIEPPAPEARAVSRPVTRTRSPRAASPVSAKAAASSSDAARVAAAKPGLLATLVTEFTRSQTPPPSADQPSSIDDALQSLGGPPDLKAMGYFRSTWTQLSAERRLTQSLARVPAKAGPLNAQHLVHQTLAAMRELSPAYLERFLDYADTLMWLERAQTPSASAPTGRAEGAKGGKSNDGAKRGAPGKGTTAKVPAAKRAGGTTRTRAR